MSVAQHESLKREHNILPVALVSSAFSENKPVNPLMTFLLAVCKTKPLPNSRLEESRTANSHHHIQSPSATISSALTHSPFVLTRRSHLTRHTFLIKSYTERPHNPPHPPPSTPKTSTPQREDALEPQPERHLKTNQSTHPSKSSTGIKATSTQEAPHRCFPFKPQLLKQHPPRRSRLLRLPERNHVKPTATFAGGQNH